jgi:hypothetical protein
MKRTIFSIIICVAIFSMQSQTTHHLTKERNAYRAADQIVKQQVVFKDPGSCGKDLIWDFRFVQAINEDYTLNYFIPDSTKMTNICGLEHNTRYYFEQKTDSILATGFENSTTFMEYTIPELRMRFPFMYGDTLFSRFEGKGQYCHRIPVAVKGYTRVKADAEGELLLPQSEIVKRAIRVNTLRQYTKTGRDSAEMTLNTYSWYAAGIRYPVFESIKTIISKKSKKKDQATKDTTVFTTSFYYPPEKQFSQIETAPIPVKPEDVLLGAAAVFTEAQLMPNPVIDNLFIKYKLVRTATIWFAIHNSSGVQMMSTTPQTLSEGEQNMTINMNNLMQGVYPLYVHVDDMVMRLNVIKN